MWECACVYLSVLICLYTHVCVCVSVYVYVSVHLCACVCGKSLDCKALIGGTCLVFFCGKGVLSRQTGKASSSLGVV